MPGLPETGKSVVNVLLLNTRAMRVTVLVAAALAAARAAWALRESRPPSPASPGVDWSLHLLCFCCVRRIGCVCVSLLTLHPHLRSA